MRQRKRTGWRHRKHRCCGRPRKTCIAIIELHGQAGQPAVYEQCGKLTVKHRLCGAHLEAAHHYAAHRHEHHQWVSVKRQIKRAWEQQRADVGLPFSGRQFTKFRKEQTRLRRQAEREQKATTVEATYDAAA